MSAYIVSKAAMESSIRAFAIELSKKKIRINCVVPGPVDTQMVDDVLPNSKVYYDSKMLLEKPTVTDVANAIIFLLGDTSRAITGRSFFVDGGYLGQ